MPDVQITVEQLWQQAANQVNVVNNLAGLEIQSDVISSTLQNLIADLQNAKIKLSDETLNGLNVLQLIAAQSSIGENDISSPEESSSINATIRRKKTTRDIQKAYYALKQKLGLS